MTMVNRVQFAEFYSKVRFEVAWYEQMFEESQEAAQREALLTATEVQRVNSAYDCVRETKCVPDRRALVKRGKHWHESRDEVTSSYGDVTCARKGRP